MMTVTFSTDILVLMILVYYVNRTAVVVQW
jgi:hypothetical protein